VVKYYSGSFVIDCLIILAMLFVSARFALLPFSFVSS